MQWRGGRGSGAAGRGGGARGGAAAGRRGAGTGRQPRHPSRRPSTRLSTHVGERGRARPAVSPGPAAASGRISVSQVHRAGRRRADLLGDLREHRRRHRVVDGEHDQRLAALLRARDLHAGDVQPGLAEDPADRADDAGTVRRSAGRPCGRRAPGRRRTRRPRRSSGGAWGRPACRRPTTSSPPRERAAHGDHVAVVRATPSWWSAAPRRRAPARTAGR